MLQVQLRKAQVQVQPHQEVESGAVVPGSVAVLSQLRQQDRHQHRDPDPRELAPPPHQPHLSEAPATPGHAHIDARAFKARIALPARIPQNAAILIPATIQGRQIVRTAGTHHLVLDHEQKKRRHPQHRQFLL